MTLRPVDRDLRCDRAALIPQSVTNSPSTVSMPAMEAASSVAIDAADRTLLEMLVANEKVSNRELATHLGISESAVSIRLRRLVSSGVLIFTALIDWEAAGFEWLVICRIKTHGRPPSDIGADICKLPQFEAVSLAVGADDILAYFLARDRREVSQVTKSLAVIDGVTRIGLDLALETATTEQGRRLFFSVDPPEIRLPAPCVDVDDLDVAIMQELVVDGRQSSRNIARQLNVAEGTVRARVSRLTNSGLIRVVAMVEPIAMGLAGVIASVSIRADRRKLRTVFEMLLDVPEVALAAMCLGQWDFNVTVVATNTRALMDVVGLKLHAIDGVRETDVLLMGDVLRFSPYLKRL
ncbi:MAG: winged helix-turn-helix transcriptional regulator [Mycobacterium sp.]|nr:winged helix-turn-helix transcriptional regulator [Mycobacterium sp.]